MASLKVCKLWGIRGFSLEGVFELVNSWLCANDWGEPSNGI